MGRAFLPWQLEASPALRRELPRNPAEAERTHANIDRLVSATGYAPKIALAEGLDRFITWFLERRDA